MDIIGKQRQKLFFDTAIKNKTYSHFYILEGAGGAGKKTLAKYVAQAMHCTGSNPPCGICGSCVLHNAGNHPDFLIASGDDDKKIFSVDAVRRVAADIFIKPLIADTKIYVISDDKPLGAEGQNAFLKILEEPPAYAVIFLLIKNADSLLQTVLSRGVLCRVEPCSHAEAVQYVKKYYPEAADRAELIANFSGGILGRAESLCTGDRYFELRDKLYAALSHVSDGGSSRVLDASECFVKNKEDTETLLELTLSWLRDALYLKTAGGENVINFDYKFELASFADTLPAAEIIQTADRAVQMLEGFKAGNNLELWSVNLFSGTL